MYICVFINVNMINILCSEMQIMENRTARLTLLIDPKKKAVFEQLCQADDATPSQMVRRFIREYIEEKLGPDWRDEVFNAESESK